MGTKRQSGFKFIAGHPALDFTNSVGWRLREAQDDGLRSYEDLLRWSRQAGLLGPPTTASLRRLARQSPGKAAGVLKRAIQVRDVTYRLYEALLHSKRPSLEDLQFLNRFVKSAARGATIQWAGRAFGWERTDTTSRLDIMLPPIIRSAADLLTSDQSTKISQCHDDRGCGWLFLDNSRSGARQWCAMADTARGLG